jgi:HEAT repeat protein
MRHAILLLCFASVTGSALGGCSAGVVDVQQATWNRDCDLLMGQLGRKEPWIVEDAASGLGLAGCSQGAEPLMALLADGDRDERVRAAAAGSLARLGRLDAVPLLVGELSRASHPETRYALVTALGRLCTPETAGALEGAAGDADIYVSRAARKGLARCAGTLSGGERP